MSVQQIVSNQVSITGGTTPERGAVVAGTLTPGFITLQITDVLPANPVEHTHRIQRKIRVRKAAQRTMGKGGRISNERSDQFER